MESIMKTVLSKNVLDIMSANKHLIMLSGICKYNDRIFNFYGFTGHYSVDKGYPTQLLLESMDESVYYHVRTEECEIIYCLQNREPKYPICLN